MTAKEFFYLVCQMREAQRKYFQHHDPTTFRACRALENDVDREIRRAKDVMSSMGL